jgi:hypothetical protein
MMKMHLKIIYSMRRTALLIIVTCLANFAYSQNDFRKGYVVLTTGDTLRGWVDYREGDKAFSSCSFKSSQDQDLRVYEPGNILGYGFVNDKVFESREVLIKGQSKRIVFLEVIVRGRISLFRYEENFLVEKSGGEIQQLINETETDIVKGLRMQRETNQHIGTLNSLMSDCDGLMAGKQKINLEEGALTKLVESYNQCKGESGIVFKAAKPWKKVILGVNAGVNVSQLSFGTYLGYEYLEGDFEVSKSLMFGLSLDALSPRLSERVSVHADVFYLAPQYYHYNQLSIGSTVQTNYVTIDLQQLKIPLGLRYTSPVRSITPFINAGLSSTLQLKSNTDWVQEIESNGVVEIYEPAAYQITQNQFGVWGGGGLVRPISDKLSAFLELRYERSIGVAKSTTEPQAQVGNFQIIIGIRTN